ncbi:Coq4 family protein [Sphingomonas crocodyli]|uniref:Ubiquinone biosynthesis protein n=1 Tax=Sphingomonas crocodyli TaxID=1979270 RepID=A0A437LUV4_9SPHN|nr:Coq4 family protein [Sphingomonas crocodyli]RVT89211.1 ubiquinone biosynthesis protein [Sphingomonas crocodyli]
MTATVMDADLNGRRSWGDALKALRALLADANDTAQVFRIVRALNGDTARKGYDRLLRSAQGGRIAYERVELAGLLSDPAYVARFAEGSVGGAYRDFLSATGYSAEGLADVSRSVDAGRDAQHPYAWFGRRMRDSHDIWHVLTGYQADDPLGEACLVAFTFGQSGGLGWALIAGGAMAKALRMPGGRQAIRAIHEGYRRGRSAAWLAGEDMERLLAEPLADARRRLGLTDPAAYRVMSG